MIPEKIKAIIKYSKAFKHLADEINDGKHRIVKNGRAAFSGRKTLNNSILYIHFKFSLNFLDKKKPLVKF